MKLTFAHLYYSVACTPLWRRAFGVAPQVLLCKVGRELTSADLGRKTKQCVEAPRNDPAVSGARLPHTVTTSTWSDGTLGPLILLFSEGTIAPSIVDQWNAENDPSEICVLITRKESHFADAALTVEMYSKAFTPAFRKKRRVPGLPRCCCCCWFLTWRHVAAASVTNMQYR